MTKQMKQNAAIRWILRACVILVLAAGIAIPAKAAGLTTGQKNIVERANRQTQIEWIPWRDVQSFSIGEESSFVFGGGQLFHGLPYGQVPKTSSTPPENGYYVPDEESFNAFLEAVADPESDFYTRRAYYSGMESPWYAGDCSSFVSYCLGIRRTTTYGIWQKTYSFDPETYSFKVNGGDGYSPLFLYLATIEYREEDESGEEQPAEWESRIEVGDILNKRSVHTVMITDVIRDADGGLVAVEVSENTPPLARRWSYGSRKSDRFSFESFFKRFENYQLVRYDYRDVVTAPKDPYTPQATGIKGTNLTEQYKAKENADDNGDANGGDTNGGDTAGQNSEGTDPSGDDNSSVQTPAPVLTTGSGIQMTRLYNPDTHEHLHTKDANEVRVLTGNGWKNEGSSWVAPETSATPVYRLFNRYSKEHFYTKDAYERSVLIKQGWNDEGIGWYSADETGVPVYRLFNAAAGIGAHHYTTDAYERSVLINNGWADEGIAWYGMQN